MPKYNGHRSWRAWNVSLWLNNDEWLYETMQRAIRSHTNKDDAARYLAQVLEGDRTPDGAPYTYSTIRLAMREV